MGSRMKKFLIGILVSVIILTGIAGTGLIVIGRPLQGILQGGAYIIASDAPTLDKRMGKIFHTFYGNRVAVCDGTDDNIQIQAALDALPSIGGEVVLSSGEFGISGNITMNSYDVLRGQGPYQTTINATANNVGIVTASITSAPRMNVGIYDLRYDGDNTAYTGTFFFYGNIRYSQIRNVDARYCGTNALTITNITATAAPENRISGCDLRLNDGIGIYLYGRVVESHIFDNNIYSNTNAGIKLQSASSASANLTSHAYIHNNFIEGNEYGIEAADVASLNICLNEITQNDKHGIYLYKDLSAYSLLFQIIGNNFYSNSMATANTYDSINANGDNSTYVINRSMILGNVFSANSKDRYFVYLGAYSGSSIVQGNNFHTNVATAAVYNGAATNRVMDNIGWVTEKWGTSSIVSGQTTIAFAHGLAATPTSVDFGFKEQGTSDYGRWWWTANSTNITLSVSADPGASNLDFSWAAYVR